MDVNKCYKFFEIEHYFYKFLAFLKLYFLYSNKMLKSKNFFFGFTFSHISDHKLIIFIALDFLTYILKVALLMTTVITGSTREINRRKPRLKI
jgi:hypothetical protein